MNQKMVPTLFIALVVFSVVGCADCRNPGAISQDHLELEKRLQTLNKPPVKTIVYKETGDVIDCVPINEQPAFDHPNLKNHKIQLHPTFSTHSVSASSRNNIFVKSLKLRGTGEACPDGTVPIKRITKEDLIRTDALSHKIVADERPPIRKANVRLENNQWKLYGAYGVMALHNLTIADDQESSTDITVENGPPGQVDEITVGWKVSHGLNGDKLTRSFGFWHDYNGNKGCYNTLCAGFVQVDKEIFINYAFQKISIIGDFRQQYAIALYLQQDRDSGNWWLSGGEDNVQIGYWPKELFPNLVNGANALTWGGTASLGANGEYAPMGNGHLPNGFYKDTSYFDNVEYVNSAYEVTSMRQAYAKTRIDSPGPPLKCYGLDFATPKEELKIKGFSFIFGGPGGACGT